MPDEPTRTPAYDPKNFPGRGGISAEKRARYSFPKKWKEMSHTAAIEVEVEWVHANLGEVAETRTKKGGRQVIRINYAKCLSPPPSYGALTMLKVAAKNPEKFEDSTRPKILKSVTDVGGQERKEKRSVEEIRNILKRFEDAGKGKPVEIECERCGLTNTVT